METIFVILHQILRRRCELDLRDALARLQVNAYEAKQRIHALRLSTTRLLRHQQSVAMCKWVKVTALVRRQASKKEYLRVSFCRAWGRRCKTQLNKAWWKWVQVVASQREWQQQAERVRSLQICYPTEAYANQCLLLLT